MSSAANSSHKNDLPSTVFVKLDRDNYPLWKSMVLPIIRGARLDGYMLGKKECPEEFITAADSSKKFNPEFEDWQAYDQQLLGWLRNSMTVGIATQLLHCETSMQLWEEAHSLAGAHTRSQITYLKSEFHSTRKGEMKMEDYLIKMKNLADKLKLAGNPISTSDLIIQTLNGLDSEYNPVVVKLSDQTTLIWVDLQAQLLTFENRIEQLNNLTNLTLNATANVANRSNHRGNRFNSNNNWRGSNFRGWRGGRGRGRSSKTPCQVCGRDNHIAIDCFYRFDKTYSRSNHSSNNDKQGSHNVFLASQNSVEDYDWYFDSGASNHVTHQTNKFQDMAEHHGKNSLVVGNGEKLEIVATGRTILRGTLKDGLYQLSEKDSSAYVSVKESWHRKLGHPNNKEILELVHTDVWGPAPIISSSGFKYYVHFIDDFTRFTWIYPLKQKSDTAHAFIQFKNMVENQFNKRIKTIQCDGGGEYKAVQKHAIEAGIQFRMSCPYTSQQNGRAERKHRHIAEFGLTLLAQAKMPLNYWWEAFSTAVYLINRLPSPVTHNESPYSLLHKKEPDYNSLKPFGCACYPCLKPYNKHKLQFHTTKCVFLGYSNSHKGYKCVNSHGRVFISRHVVFNEDHFPFHDGFLNTRVPLKTLTGSPSSHFPLHVAEPTSSSTESSEDNINTEQASNELTQDDDADVAAPDTRTVPIEVEASNNTHWMRTRSKDGIRKPKLPYIGLAENHIEEKEPGNAQEALRRPEWKEAMHKEFQALMTNQTWTLIPYQDQESIIDSEWVFKIKYKADGTIERRKARLVAKGFQQTAGLGYEETFSPVVKASTIRIILSIAVHLNWEVKQLDINNAFLNGNLKETVFMNQPEGFIDPTKPNHVCKLSKAIYGLRQAPRAWFDSLKNALLSWGFQNTKSDSSLFTLRGRDHITFLLIYVDDIIVTGNNTKFLETFIKQLNIVFSLKDLGNLHYFLGIEVQRDAGGIYLKQSKYINDLLRKFKMESASSCPTPMITGRQFTAEGEKLKDPSMFRQ
ncbi:hypothetical protein TSUD_330400, partial [Trifolium subterraneum]